MGQKKKANYLSDAKIQFVSLVEEAANNRRFLIVKNKNGQMNFSTLGRIIKKDSNTHYVTGVVYEPETKDTQGDCMTAEEITKAAYWFAKNGDGIDFCHDSEKLENAVVVESWIAKADFSIGDEQIMEGTWLITVEVSDPDVWEDIENGEITGFSMGGTAVREEDTEDIEKKGFWKSMFKKLNVKKGAVADEFNRTAKSALFWRSFESLGKVLAKYDYRSDEEVFEADEETIKEALSDFCMIVQGILTETDIASVLAAAAPIEKSGKKISGKNMDTLKEIHEMLSTLIEGVQAKEEEVKKSDSENVEELVTSAIAKAMEPLYKSRGIPTNLNNEPEPVKKSNGVFDGYFV